MKKHLFAWVLRLIAAILLLQTLYFKFSAHPESVEIFSKLGVEPWGRILTGVLELIASLLLLIPRFTLYGAILGLGLMAGAIVSHLTVLGIVINGDASLFFYGVAVFFSCAILVWIHKEKLPFRSFKST